MLNLSQSITVTDIIIMFTRFYYSPIFFRWCGSDWPNENCFDDQLYEIIRLVVSMIGNNCLLTPEPELTFAGERRSGSGEGRVIVARVDHPSIKHAHHGSFFFFLFSG